MTIMHQVHQRRVFRFIHEQMSTSARGSLALTPVVNAVGKALTTARGRPNRLKCDFARRHLCSVLKSNVRAERKAWMGNFANCAKVLAIRLQAV